MTFPDKSSSLGNPVDRGACQATVYWVAKSQTQLNNYLLMLLSSPTALPTHLPFFFFFFNFGHAARLAVSPFPELGPWQ